MVYNSACKVLEIEQFGGLGHFGCLGSLGCLRYLDLLVGCLGKNIKYLSFILEPMGLKNFSVLFEGDFRVDVDYEWPF